MPKLTFEIEVLSETQTSEVRDFILMDVAQLPGVVRTNEIFELPAKKQSKEMYYKGLWNKFFAEMDMLGDNEFGDLTLLISEQLNKASKFRIEQRKKNDAKLKGLIIN